jgi:hypothetical protein
MNAQEKELRQIRRLLKAADALLKNHPIHGVSLVFCLGMRWERFLNRQLRKAHQ